MADFVNKKEFTVKLFTSIGIILVTCSVLGVLILLFGLDIARRANSVQGYKKDAKAALENSLSVLSLKSDFERAKPYVSVFDNILPIRDQLIAFPKDVALLAQKSKVEAGVSFGSETEPTDKYPGFVGFSMTMAGSYSDILQFMQSVERGKYVVDWGDVNFSLENKNYNVKVSGRVFFL